MTKPRILALFGTRVIFGAERGNIEALAALRDQGCKILCLVRHESWNDHVPAALTDRELAWRKVPFIDGWLPGWRLRTLVRNPIAFLAGNWRAFKIAREFRPTHIQAFNMFHVLSFIPILVLLRIPLIYYALDEPTLHRGFWRILWSFIAWRSNRFVAVSKFTARSLMAANVASDKIEVIYGRAPKHTAQISASVDMHFPNDIYFRNIVFVGQIAAHKGPHLLVHAFRNVAQSYPTSRLLIAGRISEWRGDDWARRLRDEVVNDSLLSNRIVFLGLVEDVPALLRNCEVLVAPSIWEDPLPLVVTESKEAAIPAIVFPSGGLPEVIEHCVNGYICSDKTVGALEDALRFYLDDPSLAKQQGIAAKDSLTSLGILDFARKWLDVYQATGREGKAHLGQ